jgi:lipid A 3-O-deacylase
MIFRDVFAAAGLLAVLSFAAIPGTAASPESAKGTSRKASGTIGIHVENDIFAGTDRGYTNGFKLVWLSPEIGPGPGHLPLTGFLGNLARRLPFFATPVSRRYLSLSLGQNIFTPQDIWRRNLIIDDRPYAGFTYGTLGFYARGPSVLDGFEATIGVVGPASLGGDVQKFLHRTFGWTRPEGWPNQIKNELILGFGADRKWKVRKPDPTGVFDWDAIVRAHGRISNAVTGAGAGLEIRAGRNLPRDFGSSFILPGGGGTGIGDEFGFRTSGAPGAVHAFAVFEAQAVARDIFLDGNTFRESHRVVKRPLVADMAFGLVFRKDRVRASFAYVLRSRRFVGQTYREIFGAFNLSLNL